jgi:acyl carrier protein
MTRGIREIEGFIAAWIKEQLEQEVDAEANFAAIGMDSLDAVRFTDELAEFMGLDELPISLMLDHPTAAALARYLAQQSSVTA